MGLRAQGSAYIGAVEGPGHAGPGGSGGALGTIGLGLRPESRSGTRSRIAPTCGALLAVAEREGRGTGRAGPEEKGKRAATGWSLGRRKKKGRVGWQRKEKEKKRVEPAGQKRRKG